MRLSVASAVVIFFGVSGVTLVHSRRQHPPTSPGPGRTPALQDASGKGADRDFDRLAGRWSSGECTFSGDWVLGHQFFRMTFEGGATPWIIMARRDPAAGGLGGVGGVLVFFYSPQLQLSSKELHFFGPVGASH